MAESRRYGLGDQLGEVFVEEFLGFFSYFDSSGIVGV
jgi:hypothetical protein